MFVSDASVGGRREGKGKAGCAFVSRPSIALVALMLLSGCGRDVSYVAPPPPKVTVVVPVKQPVTRYVEATGNAAAVNTTNLVARVSGFLQEINYKDGDLVKQGATLFTIEPEPYKLKLEQARAAEAGAQATLKQTEAEYERQADLSSRQVASKQALDNALANRDAAQAKLKQAQVDTSAGRDRFRLHPGEGAFDGFFTRGWCRWANLSAPTARPSSPPSSRPIRSTSTSPSASRRSCASAQDQAPRADPGDLKKVPVEVGLQSDEDIRTAACSTTPRRP